MLNDSIGWLVTRAIILAPLIVRPIHLCKTSDILPIFQSCSGLVFFHWEYAISSFLYTPKEAHGNSKISLSASADLLALTIHPKFPAGSANQNGAVRGSEDCERAYVKKVHRQYSGSFLRQPTSVVWSGWCRRATLYHIRLDNIIAPLQTVQNLVVVTLAEVLLFRSWALRKTMLRRRIISNN